MKKWLAISSLVFLVHCGKGFHLPTLGTGTGTSIGPGSGSLSVSTISPSSGNRAGGQTVTISGMGFGTDLQIKLGASPCTSVNALSTIQATCVTPSGSGTVDVIVSRSDGKSATLTNGFSFQSYLVVVNTNSSTVSVFSIRGQDGTLTEISGSPFSVGGSPFAYAAKPGGRYLFTANNSANSLSIFQWNSLGGYQALAASPLSAGAPTEVVAHPNEKFVYTANTPHNVGAYSTGDGQAAAVSGSPFVANFPAFLTMDPQGRFLFLHDGTDLLSFTINQTSGALNQAANIPYHDTFNAIAADPSGKFLWISNASTAHLDRVDYDQITGALTLTSGVTASDGPYIGFARGGQNLYFVSPSPGASQVHGFSVSGAGALSALNNSPYATGAVSSALWVTPNDKFLYVTNQSEDTVSGFAINPSTGELTSTGAAATTGSGPVAIASDPDSKYLYITNQSGNSVSAYRIDSVTGVLTPIGGSLYGVGTHPSFVVVQ